MFVSYNHHCKASSNASRLGRIEALLDLLRGQHADVVELSTSDGADVAESIRTANAFVRFDKQKEYQWNLARVHLDPDSMLDLSHDEELDEENVTLAILSLRRSSSSFGSSFSWNRRYAELKLHEFEEKSRQWLFEKLEKWHWDPVWAPIFSLEGLSGIGKTVAMAKICQLGHWFEDGFVFTALSHKGKKQTWRKSMETNFRRLSSRAEIRKQILVAAAHFFQYDDIRTQSANHALLSISLQLSENIPGFFEQAQDALTSIVIANMDVSEVFKKLISEPTSKLELSLQQRVSILFDSVDDCTQGKEELLLLLQNTWIEEMPSWVGLVFSMRQNIDREDESIVTINMDCEANREELRARFSSLLKPHLSNAKRDLHTAVEVILSRSKNRFTYVKVLEHNLSSKQKKLNLKDVNENVKLFPKSLRSAFERFKNDDDFGLLCIAREPLPSTFIFMDHPFLLRDAKQVRLAHKSMRDALALVINREKSHQRLAEFCMDNLSTFGARHVVYHLCESNEHAFLSESICDFTWLEKILVDCVVDPDSFVFDCNHYFVGREEKGASEMAKTVILALEKGLDGLRRDIHELPGQLFGRLESSHQIFLNFPESLRYPWVKPRFRSLLPADSPLIRTLVGHSKAVRAIAMGAGDLVVSSSNDKTLRVWSWKTGELIHTLEGHLDEVEALAVDDHWVVSGSSDNLIKIWSLETGKMLRTIEAHVHGVTSVAMNSDVIVSSGFLEKEVKVWSAKSAKLLRTLRGHSGDVFAVCIYQKVILTASDDNTVCVWSLKRGKLKQTFRGHSASVFCVSMQEDVIASGSDDATVKVWSLKQKKQLGSMEGHVNRVASVCVHENVIISGSLDNTVKVWSISSFEMLRSFEQHLDYVFGVAAKGNTVVSASADHTINVWSLKSRNLPMHGHKDFVHAVALDKKFIVTASRDQTVKVWSLSTGELFRSFEDHSDGVVCVAVDGDVVVSGSSDESIKAWSVSSGELLQSFQAHSDGVISISVHGNTVASAGILDTKVMAWSLKTGELLQTFTGHSFYVNSVALFKDMVVSGSGDATVKIWSLQSGQVVRTLEGHSMDVTRVSIIQDGAIIKSRDQRGRTILWSTETGEELTPSSEMPLTWNHSGRVISFNDDTASFTLDGNVRRIFQPLDDSFCITFDVKTRAFGVHVFEPQDFQYQTAK